MAYMASAFVVSPEDQLVLEQWLRSPTVSQAWALRADIVLSLARGEGTRAGL